jgi:hypothetical protein
MRGPLIIAGAGHHGLAAALAVAVLADVDIPAPPQPGEGQKRAKERERQRVALVETPEPFVESRQVRRARERREAKGASR